MAMREPLYCEACGAIQWKRAPRLAEIRALAQRYPTITSRDVSDSLGIGIAAASNAVRHLTRLRVLRRVETVNVPGGGIEHVYALSTSGATNG